MKTTTTLFSAIAATLLSSAAFAADSGDRTSMPAACAERDANCVIQDGAPRRRNAQQSNTSTPSGTSTDKGRTGSARPDASKPGDTSR